MNRMRCTPLLVATLLGFTAAASSCLPAAPAALAPAAPTLKTQLLSIGARLPNDDTLAVMAAPRLTQLLKVVDQFAQLDELSTRRERLAMTLVEVLGHDVSRTVGLSAVGVDVDGAAVAAWLQAPEQHFILVLPLRDADIFRAALYRYASDNGAWRARPEVTAGRLLLAGTRLAVMLDGASAFIVVGPEATPLASRMVGLQPAGSLARRSDFRRAASGAGGGVLWAYTPPRVLVYPKADMDPRWAGADLAETAEQLALMQRAALAASTFRDGDTGQLQRLDAAYRLALSSLRDDATAQLLRRYLGTLGGASLSLRLTDDSARAAVRLPLSEQQPLAQLLVGDSKPPQLVAAPAAAVQISARLEPEGAVALLAASAILAFGGDDSEDENPAASDAIYQQLAASWDGRVSLQSVSLDGHEGLRTSLRLGMRGAEQAAAMLQALRTSPARSEDTSTSTLRLFGRSMLARLDAGDLVLTMAGTTPPQWPRQPVSQLSVRLALAALVSDGIGAGVPSFQPAERPVREPAVKASQAYRDKLLEVGKAEQALKRALSTQRVQQRRRNMLAGHVRLQGRAANGHFDLALTHVGSRGAAVALNALLSDDGEVQRSRVYRAADEVKLLGMDLARIYRAERASHEAAQEQPLKETDAQDAAAPAESPPKFEGTAE